MKRQNPTDGNEEKEEDAGFEELGLDPRLTRALSKKGIAKATPIQREAIPLILEGKDIVARAKTGSGKTFAYLLPMLQKLFSEGKSTKHAPSAFILVPTRELCQQVCSEVLSLLEFCRVSLRVIQLTASMLLTDMKTALAGPPDIVVSTPACISTSISKGVLQASSIKDSLSMLILDEADLLLSYGYEDDLKSLISHVPRRCQCLLMSATSSSDVDKLKKLVLHNPVILTLSESIHSKDEIIPKNVQQFLISCSPQDKLLNLLALLKLELVQKKVLIFVNSIDMGFRIRLFLEQFGIRSAVLNAELPQNSRLHILEEFNAGLFDYLIATDDSQTKIKEQKDKENRILSKKSKKQIKNKVDGEFGVVRGIDFKNVFTVVNFDMPETAAGYIHRIGRTGRAFNTGVSVSLVSPGEDEIIEEIKSMMGYDNQEQSDSIIPFPLLTKSAVESLRYRAEDVAKIVTKIAVRESRAQEIRNEIINSDKLKAHFDHNPKDLELLKHDKLLSKKAPPSHLREVPEYLVDKTTKEASKLLKLSMAAMGIQPVKKRPKLKRGLVISRDPLKTSSAERGRKRYPKGKKRKMKFDEASNRGKKAKHEA
ncbi:DEAD-box ATP-dependent RNA helicase 16-like [Zingiber officinale]|uniref:DEAD-box ATP-dependent RNA helicase 16-like n=1 Tax=Zingiber officinale TaxID=94328 RepID=UPI001C4B66DA|nr:DEAD-box ATP-dependent RNA helicase 16-like [Zingiber officinale]